MPTAQRTDFIPAPVDTVFDAIAEPERIIIWHPHFRAVRPVAPGPLAVGSRLAVTSSRMGPFELEILLYERGRRYSAGGTVRGVYMVQDHELAPVDGGTQLTLTATARASGFSLFGLLMPLLVRKSVATNAAALSGYLTANQPARI